MKALLNGRLSAVICALVMSILAPLALAATPASAAPAKAVAAEHATLLRGEASGVVAVHNGRFGYQEIVIGKASTRRIAGSSFWNISATLASITGYGIPLAVMLQMYQFRAQDAINTGQCFALVRPAYGFAYLPAKTGWDCR